jgi:Alcohol dehydrogenase, class IV
MSDENRSKLMIASYLGGSAIGMTLVGLVHPFSAGLSVVLGLRHCVSNCIVMQVMEKFYPVAFRDFMAMAEKQQINIPDQVCANLSEQQFKELYESMIVHSKPLENALGSQFQKILSEKMVRELYEKM